MLQRNGWVRVLVTIAVAWVLSIGAAASHARAGVGPRPSDEQIRAAAKAFFEQTYTEQNFGYPLRDLRIAEIEFFRLHAPPAGGDPKVPVAELFPDMAGDHAPHDPGKAWTLLMSYRASFTAMPAQAKERKVDSYAFAWLRWDRWIERRADGKEETVERLVFRSEPDPGISREDRARGWVDKQLRVNGGIYEKGWPGCPCPWTLYMTREPQAGGYPLCDGAKGYFGSMIDPNAPTHIRVDLDELRAGFRLAISRYEARHPDRSVFASLPPSTASLDTGLFLFGHNPPASAGKRFSFTRPEERALVEKSNSPAGGPLYDGTFTPRRGTEAALVRAIAVEVAQRKGEKLDVGDVLTLSLEQTDGDVRLATLLAHNTLRALARGEGDVNLSGIHPNATFFEGHFKVLRGGLNPGEDWQKRPGYADDNGGVWYHLFGTAFYEMHNAGKGPLFSDWTDMDTATMHEEINRQLSQLPRDEITRMSSTAQIVEDYYRRWWSGQAPDPEKFCFNLYGAWIGGETLRELVARGAVRGGPAGPNDPPPTLGLQPTDWTRDTSRSRLDTPLARKLDGHRNLVRSPVSITWEGPDGRMTFDQERKAFSGWFPVLVSPVREPESGTWGMFWVDTSNQPYTVRLEGSADGTLHLYRWKPDATETRGFVVPVSRGEQFIRTLSIEAPDAPLVRERDGADLRPLGTSTAPGPRSVSDPVVPPADTCAGGVANLLDTMNTGAVGNGAAPPRLVIRRPTHVTEILSYHWNGGRGARPGSIQLKEERGDVYGPWKASGMPGQGGVVNAYWRVEPRVTLPPGRYVVVDSDSRTWSQNSASGGSGFVTVRGCSR